MKFKFFARLILVAFFLFAGDAVAAVKIAPLEFTTRTLPNGLKIVALKDNSAPTVTIQMWYRVGAKDDPNGRSGFAHLFEHLMFKSTKNMKSEAFDRLTEDVGGFNNASTWNDFTNYYQVVPSNHLEPILWAEAERMVNLNVDQPDFISERDVVKEEFRQGILNEPYGRFLYTLEKLSFVKHPYQRPAIGNIAELDAANLDDVRNFYRTFYRPDNALLIVAGDFDAVQLDFWIDKYFWTIRNPANKIPRVSVIEPERTAEKRFVERFPNVAFPAVAVSFLVPGAKSDDAAALEVAEAILSDGESSRLYNQLVYKQEIAQTAAVQFESNADRSLFTFYSIGAGTNSPAAIEKSMLAEITKLQTAPPSALELEKAKNNLITDALSERETNEGKGFALGYAETIYGDAGEANRGLEKLQKVTANDVQKAAQKYFTKNNRVVFYYLNQDETEKKQ